MTDKISPRSEAILPPLLVLLCVVLFSFLAVWLQGPPAAVAETAPASEFSSARARKHLGMISRKPHPTGTEEHTAVRDYLLGQLTALGLSPEVQETVGINSAADVPYRVGSVRNVIARLKGTENTKAILLAGHYDSVAPGPGASDDGAAVAAMLETLRALKTTGALKNDVIFFFSDGEEGGLLGANAFTSEHPWAKDVGLVLNFEARGYYGASIMFQTTDYNGWLIREFARAAPHPIATSLAYEIYRRLPNDTDFSAFKNTGVGGLNFAYINGVTHYHTALDNNENLDERSLQHHGSYALALTRHFGNLDLRDSKSGNAVYFDIFGSTLVHYSAAWVIPFAILTTLLFVAVIFLGLRKKQLSLLRIALSFLLLLVGLVVNAVLVTLFEVVIETVHPGYQQMRQGVTYNSSLYTLCFLFFTLALASLLFVVLRKKLGWQNLAAGALLCCVAAMWFTGLSMPGASYLFTWPLLFSLLGFGYVLNADERAALPKAIVLSLVAIPGLIIVVPAIYHIAAALPLFLSGAVMILVLLALGLLIPQLDIIAAGRKWALPAVSLLAVLIFIVAGELTSGINKQHPLQDNVFYGLDADLGKAVWASLDDTPDEWSSQFFPTPLSRGPVTEFLPLITVDFMKHEAPLVSLPAPEVTLLNESKVADGRTLTLRVTSPRQAPFISIYVNPKLEISSASVNGKPISAKAPAATGWGMIYYALPATGAELTLEVKSLQPVELRAIDLSYELPPSLTSSLRARPDSIVSTFLPFSDSTLVSKFFRF